ncbi:MAG: hypothetical protein E7366_04500 [Clostridiales bacterium]|jgi:protein-tyrosine-phosphatase|nr:hypothetical protein [Clostridiales bacterium]
MSVKKRKIIFVCTGNTCRSPMAELLLKKALIDRNLKGIDVASAGIQAKRGDTINPKSKFVLEENGFICEEFKSRKLTDKMLKDAYAIVCMTEKHREYLLDARWNAMRKAGEEDFENTVYSFCEITGYDVMDPYGKDVDCYRYVFRLLEGGMSALIDKLGIPAIAQKPKKRGRPKKSETENKI